MIILKIKHLLIFLVFTLLLCSCNNENDKINRVSDKEKIFKFLDRHKNDEFSYYDSSSIKPGDKLYVPVLAIQRKRWDIALPLLEDLVKDNNPDAMYWLASISGGSALSGVKMAALFEKSANLGNPYAALRLNSGAKDCDLYLRGYCNKKWGDKAKDILAKKASSGDVRAEYQLAILNGKSVNDTLDLALKNANDDYFFPLYNYLDYNYSLDSITRKKLYEFMTKKMFAPVGRLMFLNFIRDSFESSYYDERFSTLESTDFIWNSVYNINTRLFNKKPDRKYIKNIIRAKFVLEALKNSDDIDSHFTERDIKDVNIAGYFNIELQENKIDPINDKELNILKEEALSVVNKLKPIVFIDQFYFEPDTL